MHTRRDEIVTLLRRRILTGLRTRALKPGRRLPSTRELAAQLGSDPRVVLAAYRQLADEGLVELRPRSGIYLGRAAAALAEATPPASWLVEVLLDGIGHEIPAPALGGWLTRATSARRLRAVLVAHTVDEREGIAQELRADYGLEVEALSAEEARAADDGLAARLRDVELAVTAPGLAEELEPIAQRAGIPLVVARVGPDLLGDEWRLAGAPTGWVVHVDPDFAGVLREQFADAPEAIGRLHLLRVDDPDVWNIPAAAAVYVTRAARARLGEQVVPGRHVAPARVLAPSAARALLHAIVAANLASDQDPA